MWLNFLTYDLVAYTDHRHFWRATPTMDYPTLPLTGLSPVSGKRLNAQFDNGMLSSDGGLVLLREVEQRFAVADRLPACIKDPRAPDRITHSLADMIRFCLMMIAAGYEDGNDASSLRIDPAFKMALGLAPSDRALCSQPTISRLENLPDTRALLHIGRSMVDLYCESFRNVPKRIVLNIDDTFDAVRGGQQVRLFNAHHDECEFQPIVVFDGEGRFITAVLRPAKRPGGKEIRAFLRRLMRAIRANWPKTEILLRGDSHYCCPEVVDWRRAGGHEFILGVAPTSTLRRHIADLEVSIEARFDAAPQVGKARRFKSFHDGAKAGAASSGLSPVSRSAITVRTPTSSSPISRRARPAGSTSRSTAAEVRPKITSSPGKPTSLPIAHPAQGPPPTSCAYFFMPGPTGSCGTCVAPCPNVQPGVPSSSIPCACASSRSLPASPS